ncbi:hypothetical protein JRQ81_014313 [Phrynocephalus forsythii]|uniref:Uncharacterized protein n=1 Tax=Phrynocephalus forsythii TaxID=171643 RepID=A0A9Q0XWG6_9SAUR|nr:hypothetical protein JRQ81_014313 [Phrynocephalus forsythii]
MDEPETTSVLENKAPQPPGTPPAVKKEIGPHSGQEEKEVDGEKEAAAERNTTGKAEKTKKPLEEEGTHSGVESGEAEESKVPGI